MATKEDFLIANISELLPAHMNTAPPVQRTKINQFATISYYKFISENISLFPNYRSGIWHPMPIVQRSLYNVDNSNTRNKPQGSHACIKINK